MFLRTVGLSSPSFNILVWLGVCLYFILEEQAKQMLETNLKKMSTSLKTNKKCPRAEVISLKGKYHTADSERFLLVSVLFELLLLSRCSW